MNMLALDLSLSRTGWCIGNINAEEVIALGDIVPSQSILQSIKENHLSLHDYQTEIIYNICSKVIKLIKEYSVTVVYCEALPYCNNPVVVYNLACIHGGVRQVIYALGKEKIEFRLIYNQTMKKYLGIGKVKLDRELSKSQRQKAKKQVVLDAIKSCGIEVINFDQADSAGIYLAGRRHYVMGEENSGRGLSKISH